MYEFIGKVFAVFVLAATLTTGAIAMSSGGTITINGAKTVGIIWNAFFGLYDDATPQQAPSSGNDGGAL